MRYYHTDDAKKLKLALRETGCELKRGENSTTIRYKGKSIGFINKDAVGFWNGHDDWVEGIIEHVKEKTSLFDKKRKKIEKEKAMKLLK